MVTLQDELTFDKKKAKKSVGNSFFFDARFLSGKLT